MTRFNSIPRFALPYTASDFGAAVRSLAGEPKTADTFSLLGESPKFWTGSGRQALRLILRALDLKPQSGVALPLFGDPSLPAAVTAAGHRPVFIDIDPRHLTISPDSLDAANGRFDAVVAVHLFGQVADMPAVLSAAGNVPAIEDAAHAPLSRLTGCRAGDFGIAAFYSFASTKYWPAGGGGLAVVHDPTVARNLEGLAESLPAPPRLRELRNTMMMAAKSVVFSRRLYGFVGRPMRRWADGWALLEPRLEQVGIQRAHATVACRQASRFEARVELQRANSLHLLSRLAATEDVVLPKERCGARYNYHLFPVLLRDRVERDAVAQGMWEKRVDTSMIYCRAIEDCRRFGYTGGCPVAESVAERLLTLPNHASLSSNDIDRVADAFLASLRAWRTATPTYPLLRLGIRRPAETCSPCERS
jgi:dTDP-4-amino-4,6-dideoxygalactose transaminase